MQVKFYLKSGDTITTFLSQAAYDKIYTAWKNKEDSIDLGNGSLDVTEIQNIKVLDEY